jgi:hypothetical protein
MGREDGKAQADPPQPAGDAFVSRLVWGTAVELVTAVAPLAFGWIDQPARGALFRHGRPSLARLNASRAPHRMSKKAATAGLAKRTATCKRLRGATVTATALLVTESVKLGTRVGGGAARRSRNRGGGEGAAPRRGRPQTTRVAVVIYSPRRNAATRGDTPGASPMGVTARGA